MNEGKISRRYAKALLSYAVDSKKEDQVYNEMRQLIATFDQLPKFRVAMNNPLSRQKDKMKLLNAAFDDTPSDIMSRFFDLVLTHKRENHLLAMAYSYSDLYSKLKNIVSAKLITAVPANDEMLKKICTLSHKVVSGELRLETIVSPDIEGGFVLFLDTYRLDASVKTQLKKIKQQFVTERG